MSNKTALTITSGSTIYPNYYASVSNFKFTPLYLILSQKPVQFASSETKNPKNNYKDNICQSEFLLTLQLTVN